MVLVGCIPRGHVAIDRTRVPPLILFMHSIGVTSYGRHGSCRYLSDARGTFVSNRSSQDCDPYTADGEAVFDFDTTTADELARLRDEQEGIGLPREIWVDLGYDEQGLLSYAGFVVDSCSAYNVEFDPPKDLSQADPFGPKPIPWEIIDVCAMEDPTQRAT
jgi:hypothetical protein